MDVVATILWPIVAGLAIWAWFINARDSRAAAVAASRAASVLELDEESRDTLRKLHTRLTDLERQVSILNDRD